MLECVLDRGIVIVGDIRVSLLDIELFTLTLRLVIASVDTARQITVPGLSRPLLGWSGCMGPRL
ncbi:gas vesicle protein GvpJ [Dactylosporangium sp. NPDC051485]|uniref:gas vesicle protein GvpJ n=1 Tax=Dactylosporangium sp. NPDC051485 TaxID=3154846 RepID=UPI0034414F73